MPRFVPRLESPLCALRGRAQRLVLLSAHPELVYQDGELSSDCDRSSIRGGFTPASRETTPPALQIGVRASPQDALRALQQQPAQERVPGLADVTFRIAFTGLAAPRSEPKVGAHGLCSS